MKRDRRRGKPKKKDKGEKIREQGYSFAQEEAQKVIQEIREKLSSPQDLDKEILFETIDILSSYKSEESADLLGKIYQDFREKGIQKRVKRAFYKLNLAGIGTKKYEPEVPSPLEQARTPKFYKTFLSNFDGSGSRLLIYTQEIPYEGIKLFQFILNDLEGVKECEETSISKSRFKKDIVEKFPDNNKGTTLVEITEEYCQFLLEEAKEKNLKGSFILPEKFESAKELVGEAKTSFNQPLIYDFISPFEMKLRSELLGRSDQLLDEPEFKGWFFELKEIEHFASKIVESEKSKLIVGLKTPQERQKEAEKEAIEVLFNDQRRAIFKRRLEEMSYIFFKTEREELARIALAAALGFEKGGSPSTAHPFALRMVRQSLKKAHGSS